jgi:hypothetical protein
MSSLSKSFDRQNMGAGGFVGCYVIDILLIALMVLALFIGAPVLFLILLNRVELALWRRRNPPEKLAADRRAWEERLLHPDWDFYERHLQRPAPKALRELFADDQLIVTQVIEYGEDEVISTFNALDEQGLAESRDSLGFDAVAIATNDFGDLIYLRPGPSESDAVYIAYHDGGDSEQIELAPDVSTFVHFLRHVKRNS